MFGIEEALKDLGLKNDNNGTSTGVDGFGNGKKISSYSPVDGSLIGNVYSTTESDYEKVILKSQDAYLEWRKNLLQ